MKIRKFKYSDGTVQCLYYCPGCKQEHAFNPKVHDYNDDSYRPTVKQSLLYTNPQKYRVCHAFIKEGMIQYMEDCWHDLKGKTVQLPDHDVKRLYDEG